MSLHRRGAILSIACWLIIAGLGAGAVAWTSGWRVHDMTTPSMGTAAPVGSIVISHPVNAATLHRGQIIVFHPPGRPTVTFAHRIYAISPGAGDTAIRTKGDINPTPDVWTLHQADLIGISVARVPDVGFLLQALPLLLLGTFVILLASSGLAPDRRGAARIIAGAILVAGVVDHFRPLARVDLLDEQVTHGHGIATVVPTGILPIRVSAHGGSAVDIVPGQVGVVHRAHVDPQHAFTISTSIHLSGWWWLVLLGWTIPMFIALRLTRQPAEATVAPMTPPPPAITPASPAIVLPVHGSLADLPAYSGLPRVPRVPETDSP